MEKSILEESKSTTVDLPKVLVVDDDELIRKQILWALSEEFSVFLAGDRQSTLEIFKEENIPVILLDLGLPPHPNETIEGLKLLEELIGINPLVKVIIVSGNSNRENDLAALERGAHDVFPKPVDIDELKVVLHRVYRRINLEAESIEERILAKHLSIEDIIGTSRPMQSVMNTVQKVSKTDVPVLITGESGTGKELIAQAIHHLSQREAGPFIAINCGAIPDALLESELFGYEKGSFTGATTQRKGKLEYAHGGTLFLDEIGDLAPELQVKILRFLQEKVIERVGGRETIPVNSRVIAATNKNLEEAVAQNTFREDLFFRLAVVRVALPPLRERGSDVVQLAEHINYAYSKEMKKSLKRFSQAAFKAMCGYGWPGNVRELQNRIKRALVLTDGESIGPDELELEMPDELELEMPDETKLEMSEALKLEMSDSSFRAGLTLKEAKEKLERQILAETLEENGGNISKTAKILGISRPTIYSLMSRYEL